MCWRNIEKILVGFSLLAFSIVMISGCATTRSAGDGFLAKGQYEQAITHYQGELARSPQDAHLWRNLGIAYFHQQRFDEALESFDQADRFDPNNAKTALYRGMIHEQRGEVDAAVSLYQSYLALNPDSKLASEIRYRLHWIQDKHLQKLIADAIANESSIDVANIPSNTVAVVRFDASSLPDEYKPLGRGLAELIYNDLSYVPDLKLVERLEIYKLQEELKLSQSELADQFNSPRVGKIVGAARVVTGKLDELEDKEVEIDAGIVAVGPELAKYPQRQKGSVGKIFELQKKLTYEIIEQLGYQVTPELRAAINQTQTNSVLALIAYSRGLEYADRGLFQLAEAEFQAALQEDPGFSMAQQAARSFSGIGKFDGAPRPVSSLSEMVQLDVKQETQSFVDQGDIIKRLQGSTEGAPPEDENPVVTPQATNASATVTGHTD